MPVFIAKPVMTIIITIGINIEKLNFNDVFSIFLKLSYFWDMTAKTVTKINKYFQCKIYILCSNIN